jgi:S-formylglutathione hydrolase FrmB
LQIWLDWGENDFLRRGSQAMTEALAEAGIAHEGHVFGGGHNDRYWQVHLPDYLDWHAAVWPQERESYPAC